jgi:CDP-diacylglycerol---serine O-phosphatidyltransferase
VPIRVTRSVIPSLFTTMNLFCGFFAIVKVAQPEPDYMMAVWLIILAGIFDGLDGAMARLTNSSSEFGVELDSLADVVSFGTAPAFIIYTAFFHRWDTAGVVIAALPAMCGALRLARFNVQLVGFDKNYFTGLPIPSGALVLISYLYFFHLPADSLVPDSAKPAMMLIITLGVSLLMISTIRYDTLPKLSAAGIKAAPLKSIGFLIGVILAIVTKGAGIFPFMAVYLIYGIVRQVIAMASGTNEEEEEDTLEESEPSPFDV